MSFLELRQSCSTNTTEATMFDDGDDDTEGFISKVWEVHLMKCPPCRQKLRLRERDSTRRNSVSRVESFLFDHSHLKKKQQPADSNP